MMKTDENKMMEKPRFRAKVAIETVLHIRFRQLHKLFLATERRHKKLISSPESAVERFVQGGQQGPVPEALKP